MTKGVKPRLPDELRELFESGEVFIVGSRIDEDLSRYATVPDANILDTQVLYNWMISCDYMEKGPQRSGHMCGLGIQAVLTFGSMNAFLKPCKRAKR